MDEKTIKNMRKFSEFKINEQEISLKPDQLMEYIPPTDSENNSEPIKSIDPVKVTKSESSKFFSKLLEGREMAQVYHWTVKGDNGSHAAHTALNDFYDVVIDHIDDLVEIYQGQYELIEEYDVIDTSQTKTKDKIEYFQELNQFIKNTRYSAILEEDTHLQNIIDEIVALIYKLLYKLKYNK